MKIAILAPAYLSIPPDGYGGTERIISYLTEGLVKKGHQVTLFAPGDSTTQATLFSTYPKSLGNTKEIKGRPLLSLLQFVDCFDRAWQFDLIANHAHFYAFVLSALIKKTPVCHTIHATLYSGETEEEKRQAALRVKNQNFISISDNQRQGLPELNWVKTIYNGIDLNEYPYYLNKGKYLLWLGRIIPKKGPYEAILVAKKLGLPLKMAAAIDDHEFYEQKIKPEIDGKNIEFIGEIKGKEEKARLYGEALATLYPISWHEPFGLVMTESMATGTPVVAFNIGSVSELVKDGQTGFVVKSTEEMISAVKRIDEIKRENCRKWVEDNFTIEKMVDNYEILYQQIIKSHS